MILDTGKCTVFHRTDGAQAGAMPTWTYTPFFRGWYGEVSFTSEPSWRTEGRRELRIVGKIRVLQDRSIEENDVVVLEELATFSDRSQNARVFRIVKTWHGPDDDGPTPVSDLTLEVYEP